MSHTQIDGRRMTPETAAALEASIAHWEANAVAETPEDASVDGRDCALCELFYDERCVGCPVRAETGEIECYLTPFYEAATAKRIWGYSPSDNTRDAFHAAARAEVEFLKGLRE